MKRIGKPEDVADVVAFLKICGIYLAKGEFDEDDRGKAIVSALYLLLMVLAAGAMAATASAATAPFTVLHSFNGTDGASPNALIQTADGFF